MNDLSSTPSGRSLYVPLLIGLAALLCFFGFQSYELVRARSTLNQVWAGQTTPLADGEKARLQFDALAGATAALAQRGDVDAKAIVDEFARRGIGFRAPKAPG